MTVSFKEIARYMRMGTGAPEGALADRVAELRDEAARILRPARVWRRVPLPKASTDRSSGSGTSCVARWMTESHALASHLDGCHAAFLVCGTIGAQFDAFQRRVSVLSGADALIVQAAGAAFIEKWMDAVEGEIRGELAAGESLVARYSPGYGDFPLAAQRELLEILDTPRGIGVSLTSTLTMVPTKSVSAVIGVRTHFT